MGPIEKELRARLGSLDNKELYSSSVHLSWNAWRVLLGAVNSVGCFLPFHARETGLMPDAVSYAIEAASELGL